MTMLADTLTDGYGTDTLDEMGAGLTQAGFRQYTADSIIGKTADQFWTKRVKDEDSLQDPKPTLYLLDAYVYDFSRYPNRPGKPITVVFTANLYAPAVSTFFRSVPCSIRWITLEYQNAVSIPDALAFFAETYTKLGCTPDVNAND